MRAERIDHQGLKDLRISYHFGFRRPGGSASARGSSRVVFWTIPSPFPRRGMGHFPSRERNLQIFPSSL